MAETPDVRWPTDWWVAKSWFVDKKGPARAGGVGVTQVALPLTLGDRLREQLGLPV